MRSNREDREERKSKYTSARAMADRAEAGFQATYLKIPKGASLYKPKAGKALLDIIPFEAQEGNPNAEAGQLHWERTYWVHRGIGPNSETFVCPARASKGKEPCPICEARIKLAEDDDEDSDKLRKALQPKERQLINVIDLKDPDKGVQLCDTSSFAFGDQILTTVRSADEGDDWELFFSIEDGLTLKVTWAEETIGKGRAFVKAERIDFKEREEAYDDDILDDAHALDDLPIILSYKELKAKFVAAPSAKDKDEDEDDAKPKRKRERDADDDDEKPRSRRDRDEDDDKPRKRREEDEDEPPKRKREEDEDKPRKKRDADEDEDDDVKPKRKREEDDDEPPKRKRASDEDEDEKPKRKRDADEDEDKPKSKKDKDEDDDWDNFGKDAEDEDKPKKKRIEEDEDEKPRKKRDADEDEDEKPKRRSRD